MKLRNVALVAAGMVFLALNSLAQITTVEGVVKGTDGKPLQNAEIQITRTDIKGNYKCKTDKKGHYIYMGLPMGTYTIVVSVGGKEADKVAGVSTSPGDPKPIDFDLSKSQQATSSQQAAMQKAIETGQISKDLERGMSADEKAKMEKQIKDSAEKMKKRNELNDAFNTGMTAMQNKNTTRRFRRSSRPRKSIRRSRRCGRNWARLT